MLRHRQLLAAALAATLAHSADAAVLRLSFATAVDITSPYGTPAALLQELGLAGASQVALSGYLDLDLGVLPQSAGPYFPNVYADAIRAASVTLGNRTLSFRDNPAVSGGSVEVANSSGGFDQISTKGGPTNLIVARPASEPAPLDNPAYSHVFDWAPAQAFADTFLALSAFDLRLDEYNLIDSKDLASAHIDTSQPYGSALSLSRLNLEFALGSGANASYASASKFHASSSRNVGFSQLGATWLPDAPADPTPGDDAPVTVAEPGSLALLGAGLLGLLGQRRRARA